MTTAIMEMQFDASIDQVFELVASLSNYAWRSDLDSIKVIKENEVFEEYTKDGFCTTFTITAFEPNKRYEFDIQNKNMTGHWIGTFEATNQGTILTCTEMVEVKKVIMKPLIKSYLKKQQTRYYEDLKKALLK